jgi:hypothetical protein
LTAAYIPADHAAGSVLTSAITGQGIDLLTQKILQRLAPTEPEDGEAVPFTIEQVERLEGALAALRADDDIAARAHLLALLAAAQAGQRETIVR